MISVRDVCASHPGGGRVLHDVTLDVEAGAVTALIGPNGAGKSTLLAVMARLLEPEQGQVLLDGRDVRRTPGAETARRLAVLRQDTSLAVRLTVRELVALGRFPHSAGRLTDVDRELVARAVEDVDLVDLADRRLDRLSGGQRQRAHLAMALCQISGGDGSEDDGGGYLLLDEPLAALDLKHSVRVMRLLRRRARERGLTVVVVVHDVNFAAAHADRVVAMADGRVVRSGPTADVITGPVLAALYGTEVTVHELDGQRFAAYHA
ncbi:ATP-binding cassette domain-containing protein [uncultured Pseudokineococcus sp.]|uniref:ATP-binding cassette domain-containing protein n=1 Tax=uncultured Pseudokineococcus sp. TaxID=1642928 RepID=UPI00260F1A90|nr:ATP-binding cassette domain-containing protein [uncultured Pseudokineococcus sp.]